jgi:acyl-CoA synthetase (AMP-forming)/AMP-acid ligase II/acyl carrier protein
LSATTKQLRRGRAHTNAENRIFLSLEDNLTFYSQRSPDRHAILAPGWSPMTYAALRARANNMVRGLRSIGVGRHDRVAVMLPQGPDCAVVTITVAAGAVCVPLNPSFTADEVRRYFDELRIAALLTRPDMDSACRGVAHSFGIPIIDLSTPPSEEIGMFSIAGSAKRPFMDGEFAASSDDAFILLTSGSTSRPKMVPLTHASVCLSAHNVGAVFALGSSDRLLSLLPLYHGHGLISGVIAALAAGSSVVCTSGFDTAEFFGWLTEFRPTWYTAVPAIHHAVLSAADRHKRSAQRSSLRLIRSASSTLPTKLLGGLETLFGVPVIDTFGMTEAATQIAANPVDRRKLGSVGRSAGAEIAILDDEGRSLSPGERGEIALRGPTITKGYYNDAAATQSAFRDGWFRTGDLGYLDAEGYLFIVGRIKEIINRGGQKVAPAEVEEVLLSHPDVVEAAVYSVPHSRLGADVAAAVVLREDAKVSARILQGFARERLAGFKVPGLIRIVLEIPRGPGGKIKRSELAAAFAILLPTAPVERGSKVAPPRTELERRLGSIWADILEINQTQIGVNQDVFALGADSLAVTEIILHLREHFGVEFSFRDIVNAPTVAALAARLQSLKKAPDAKLPSARNPSKDGAQVEKADPQPVSFVQQHMLRIEQELPGLPQLNLPFAYRLQGPLNVSALERSLVEVARRHDALRTGFSYRDGRPVSIITPAVDIKSCLLVEDFTAGMPDANAGAKAFLIRKAKLTAEQDSLKPIDTNLTPPFRGRLLRLGADDHVFLLVIHEIAVDGWSVQVFMRELSELYAAFAVGRQPHLLAPVLQFSEFARWQRRWSTSSAATRQLAYWKRRLRNSSPLFAPSDGDARGELAARITQKTVRLSSALLARLKTMSRSHDATLFMTLLTGFKTLLLARSGRNDICVATAMANRTQPGTGGAIGPFANTTLIRTRLDADLSFHEALNRVRDSILEAHARQQFPFEMLADRLLEETGLDPTSLIQVFFVLENAFRRPLTLTDLAVQPFGYRTEQSVNQIHRTWLTMMLKETPDGIRGTCSFKKDLFGPTAIRHWTADYEAILVKAAANPRKTLGRLISR